MLNNTPNNLTVLREGQKGQKEFIKEFENLLIYSDPQSIINTLDCVYIDWLSTSNANDSEYRTDATHIFRSLISIIQIFNKEPEIAAQIIKNLKSFDNSLDK